MKCPLCRIGETEAGLTKSILERDGRIVVIKDVPAQVCDNCGEAYFDEAVAEEVLKLANAAFDESTEYKVTNYPSAA